MSAPAPAKSAADPFPLVGIGASAGGLEAFTTLLKHLPADTGMGFVIVQHLEPTRPSSLSQLLGRVTTMPVVEIRDRIAAQPNHVYVITPDGTLSIENGILSSEAIGEPHQGPSHLIDGFFTALAAERGEYAIGIVLSGAASDGTLGLEAIKAEGGITFAQDGSAAHDSMPRHAIAAGCVDFILSPEEMAQELIAIAKHPAMGAYTSERDLPGAAPPPRTEVDDPSWNRIIQILRHHQGVDFSQYKLSTVQRRVSRRMILNKVVTTGSYADLLTSSRVELEVLFADLLIGVTSFFRNPEAFRSLGKQLVTLEQSALAEMPLRIWVVGCSTGQEAYSLAMTFLEGAAPSSNPRQLQVFATDLNELALEKARMGFYSKALVDDVSPERLRRFFVEVDGGYRINKLVRSMCVFARHNFATDPPFSRIDLVSCRNVMIYFDSGLQKKALPLFHYALKPHGLLFLGTSESVGGFTDLFEPVDKKNKIFSKNSVPTPKIGMHFSPPHSAMNRVQQPGQRVEPSTPPGLSAQREADRVTLNRCGPPGLLLDDRLQILQFRGDTSLFLRPPVGSATHNVMKMAREGLAPPLQAAIQQARKDNNMVRTEGVQIHGDGEPLTLSLEVVPLKNINEPCFLVLFDLGALRPAMRMGREFSSDNTAVAALMARVRELERELAEALDATQALQENYEFVNEELQASNEEVQSANEELQSSNEELETSKEELESTNEELTTLNEEMAARNTDLNRLVNDLNNLHISINTGIVLLGRDLTIRSFTPIAGRAFNLLTTDIGTPLHRIRHSINCPDLEAIISEVIESLTMQEREVQDEKGHWYALRVRPYMTVDNRIDGAVLVMMDIDKQLEAVRLSETRYRRLFEAAHDGILIIDPDTQRIVDANPYVEELLGWSHAEVVGKGVWEVGLFRDQQASKEAIERVENHGVLRTECLGVMTQKHTRVHLELVSNLYKEGDRFVLQCNIRDITARRQAEEARIQIAAMVNSSLDPIISKDLDGIIRSWNPAAEKLFGYTALEMIGQPVTRIIPSHLEAEETAIIERMKKGEPQNHFVTERLTKDGRSIQVLVSISPVRDSKGNIVGASKILRDMTDQVRMEREHLATSQRLQALMDALPIGVSFSDDVTCERIQGNPTVMEQFEVHTTDNISASTAESDAPGRKIRFFQKGREISDKELPLQRAVLENQPVPLQEYEVVQPSGRRWVLEASGAPIRDAKGEVIAGVSVTVDITARKRVEEALRESEERFRTMADAAPVLIWVAGPDKKCTYFSHAWLEFTGRSLEQEVGFGWTESVHPEDRTALLNAYRTAFDAQQPVKTECRLLHHSGGYRWVLGHGVPRIGSDGTLEGYIGACVDIHDQKLANDSIHAAHDTAAAASRAKDQFMAALSHELRTPLSPVLMICSAMEEKHDLPAQVRADFAMIRRNVELEARLIDDLLDVTRITEGKLTLHFETLDCRLLVERTLEILHSDIATKNLALAVDIPVPAPQVRGDAVRLQQVLWNVLKNAVKFTPVNGKIRVGAQVEGNAVRLSISDSGMGISAEEMPRIFNAFSQGEGATEGRFGGLGLGLSISSLLMNEHQGRIWAESEGRGHGAVFYVELPLASAGATASPQPSASAPSLRSLHILLVEDHDATRDILSRLLTGRGHVVTCADCLAVAREVAAHDKFDIVISDLGLPDGSGHDLMCELLRDYQMPGIALSGYGMTKDIQQSHDAGFAEHLTKPVDIRQLDAALERLFAKPRES